MNEYLSNASRRYFLGQCTGVSVGAMALSALLSRASSESGVGGAKLGLPNLPHFTPKAKRVIFLTQSGGPSQIELFDHKPGLLKLAGTIHLTEAVRCPVCAVWFVIDDSVVRVK